MGLLHWSKGSLACLAMIVMVFFESSKGDINKDKEMCENQLIRLESCLPYMGGEAKDPTKDCCSDLKIVLTKNRACLCIMIKYYKHSLGFKFNDTLALSLPDSCNTFANVSECLSLLYLQPGSTYSKIDEDHAKSTESKKKTIALPVKNDGGGGGDSGGGGGGGCANGDKGDDGRDSCEGGGGDYAANMDVGVGEGEG
ncbi:non-specific lipid transfer protein GPI-anchored 6 [Lactuca sativa]|uniref:non-specific lipid transfer protein GPI-anchored 6 n=1 Tax=Lactuca sativa TaxID=4236 RepID=UPI000CD9A9B2|nr:non-specific lipid transfer protein GPI-anchored 6 [Lactuca sativa]